MANLQSQHRLFAASMDNKRDKQFCILVDKRLINLSKHPGIGNARNKKYPNIRSTLIHKRILLVYKHKPSKNEIDLLVFWNTHQNPQKLKVK